MTLPLLSLGHIEPFSFQKNLELNAPVQFYSQDCQLQMKAIHEASRL